MLASFHIEKMVRNAAGLTQLALIPKRQLPILHVTAPRLSNAEIIWVSLFVKYSMFHKS